MIPEHWQPITLLCTHCGAEWPVDPVTRRWGAKWAPAPNTRYMMTVPWCCACMDHYHRSLWGRIRVRCLIWYWERKHRRRRAGK